MSKWLHDWMEDRIKPLIVQMPSTREEYVEWMRWHGYSEDKIRSEMEKWDTATR